LDSTTISLSLGIFNWAKYRKRKWAIKLHISIDEHWYLPGLIIFSNGKVTDNNVAFDVVDNMKWWDIIVFDRGYVDYNLWNKINSENKFFVTRTKKNTDYCPIEDIPITQPNILYDKKVELIWLQVKHRWPYRIIRYHHKDKRTNEEKDYEYVTNNFELSAEEITQLYKNRRVIETFFRRIKQNLHIKSFLWSSENAVRNQIRIALIYYLIMLFIAHQTKLTRKNLLRLSELLSEFCMIDKSIIELLRLPKGIISRNKGSPYQLWLF
jgi:transposase